MSSILPNSTTPINHRDIRSESLPFKRDKDHGSKWGMGMRPSGGVTQHVLTDEFIGGSESQRAKVRPMKQWSQMTSDRKSHQNKTPKVATVSINYAQEGVAGRLTRKVDAMIDAHDHTNSPLSKSLLDLLPQHVNNTNSSIQTALRRDRSSDDAAISGPLYSYDTNRASPTSSGREVDLGGLVELAEKKWKSEQTDRVVKEEYEVLDNRGETTVLTGGKGKGKRGSPNQRAVKSDPAVVQNVVEEDDGFELV